MAQRVTYFGDSVLILGTDDKAPSHRRTMNDRPTPAPTRKPQVRDCQDEYQWLNDAPVTFEEMIDVVDRIEGIWDVPALYPDNLTKGMSIAHRLDALKHLIRIGALADWPFTELATVITVAGTYPLTKIQGWPRFEPEGFRAKALELATSETEA